MKIASVLAMQQLDRRTIDELGLPALVLMERAALGIADILKRHFYDQLQYVHILAGNGNNGGDGLALARILANQKNKVHVWLWGSDDKRSLENKHQLKMLETWGVSFTSIKKSDDFYMGLQSASLIVDCLFGIGLNRPIVDMAAELVTIINQSHKLVVAADIPSGLHGDTGIVLGCAIKATTTVTFGVYKSGLLMDPALDYVGQLECVDIGIPHHYSADLLGQINSMADVSLPKRSAASHKGCYGRVLILAGSETMSGAAVLAAKAALKSGSGLVFLMVPEAIHSLVAPQIPEVQVLSLPIQNGRIATETIDLWQEKALGVQAILVGPGLGTSSEWPAFLQTLLQKVHCPVVLDADALNNLCGSQIQVSAPLIITPHVGELSRWTGLSTQTIQNDRIQAACQAAHKFGCITVLKGGNTLIATPDGHYWVNQTGNPGMARGGSGDILAGLLVGLLGQGLLPLTATRLAAYWHGLAGDIAAQQWGQTCMGAMDILSALPEALLLLHGNQ